jgi:hypothetical protein
MNAQTTKKDAAASTPHELARQIAEEARHIAKRAELEKAGLATETKFFLRVEPAVVRHPRGYSEHSDALRVPAGAHVFAGETVIEQAPGDRPLETVNHYAGKSSVWYEPLSREELIEKGLASDRDALRYQAETVNLSRHEGAIRAAERMHAEQVEKKAKLEQELAATVAGLDVLDKSKSGSLALAARERERIAAWIESQGYESAEPFIAALELLNRRPEAVKTAKGGPVSSAQVRTLPGSSSSAPLPTQVIA